MKINEIVNEDISRRGFLKGLGAGAAAAAFAATPKIARSEEGWLARMQKAAKGYPENGDNFAISTWASNTALGNYRGSGPRSGGHGANEINANNYVMSNVFNITNALCEAHQAVNSNLSLEDMLTQILKNSSTVGFQEVDPITAANTFVMRYKALALQWVKRLDQAAYEARAVQDMQNRQRSSQQQYQQPTQSQNNRDLSWDNSPSGKKSTVTINFKQDNVQSVAAYKMLRNKGIDVRLSEGNGGSTILIASSLSQEDANKLADVAKNKGLEVSIR